MKDLSKDDLIKLYTVLKKIRQVQIRIEHHYSEDQMKTPVHLCIGQEASAAGFCLALEKDDYVFSNHRGHGHYIAKGGDLKAMIAELYCKKTGCSMSKGGSMHLVDPSVGLMGSSSIVGGGIPLATGAALASALKKDKRVSVVFFGDGAVDEGVIYESINFAVLKKLPIIFVCENNSYSVCSPLRNRQPDGDIFSRFEGFKIPSFLVDGTAVIEVYRLAKKVVAFARKGKGPSFIECRAYRWRGHAGAGDDISLGYRTQEDLDEWIAKCPVNNFSKLLIENNIFTQQEKEKINKVVEKEIDEAFEFAISSPFPEVSELDNHVYQ